MRGGHGRGPRDRLCPPADHARQAVPIVPVCINTYYPPNQPTPRRCYKLGQAIRAAVESYPGDIRVGIVALGRAVAFRRRRGARPRLSRHAAQEGRRRHRRPVAREKLNSGSSEIRNWICVAGAVEHLSLEWSALRAGLSHPGRHRHRPRLRLLVVTFTVTPAKAGVQGERRSGPPWIPACAGMTRR